MPGLVLTRRQDESIVISGGSLGNDVIKVTCIEQRGCAFRIRIEAPATITVHREEVHQRMKREGWQVR